MNGLIVGIVFGAVALVAINAIMAAGVIVHWVIGRISDWQKR